MTGTVAPVIPTIGNPNSTEDPNVRDSLVTIRDALNAVLTSGNLLDGTKLGTSTTPLTALVLGASGQILVANGSGVPTYVTTTGDVTTDTAGVLTLGDGKVSTAKIANAAGTSPKLAPSGGQISQTGGALALTASYADVTGATVTFTPTVASKVFVTATWDLNVLSAVTNNAADSASARLLVDGSQQGQPATFYVECQRNSSTNMVQMTSTVSRAYAFNLAAAAHTLKLQAKVSSVSNWGGFVSNASFTYVIYSQ